MLTILLLLVVLTVLFGAAALLTSDRPLLADAPPDAADLALPDGPVQPEDVAALRFSMAPRGYRMSEVDDVLDRLAAELADRDHRLALLEATVTGGLPPAPDRPTAAAGPASTPAPAPGPRRPEPQGAQQPQRVQPLPPYAG